MVSPNDPSFFEPVLSPNAPACRSAGLTPVSISNMTAPPGFLHVDLMTRESQSPSKKMVHSNRQGLLTKVSLQTS